MVINNRNTAILSQQNKCAYYIRKVNLDYYRKD